jgi:hypothetical protein
MMPLEQKPWVRTVADTVIGLCLVAWVGGHAALGAFAARILFRDLPRSAASQTMTTVFRSFDTLILTAMFVLLAAAVLRALTGVSKRADRIVVGACFALVALGAFEVVWLHPHIEGMFLAGRTLEPAFASMHRLSARCANVEIALAALILGGQAWARARS